ncbi:MAG: hypothetical protein KC680_02055 [Candidatus Peregrinibacteria bacterium]|nr:hypothetical protein [Candidatus Peregrinibacteria bacterium]MCB9808341.1 hypothetical protein [Candidatus Peribacteria bacterium]
MSEKSIYETRAEKLRQEIDNYCQEIPTEQFYDEMMKINGLMLHAANFKYDDGSHHKESQERLRLYVETLQQANIYTFHVWLQAKDYKSNGFR